MTEHQEGIEGPLLEIKDVGTMHVWHATAQQVRIATTELYLDSFLHPAWSLTYDRQQGWIWLEQRPGPGRSPTAESTEPAHCYGFLVVPEPDPAALWRKVNRYTSQSNFVGELSELDQRKWQEWNLTLPLRAAVLLGAGASYPLRVPVGGQLLKRLFDRLRAISGLEREYAIAKGVRDKERRSGQQRGTEDVNAEQLIAGLERRIAQPRRQLTPRIPSDEYIRDLKYSEEEYVQTIDMLVRLLVDLVRIADKSALWYLLPLVNAGKERPLTIASLNYDLAIEHACALAGVPCTTGIESWARTEEFPKPEAGIDLLKLHGSIDWEYRPSVWRLGRIPEDKVVPRSTGEVVEPRFPDVVPAVIFGSGNKLTTIGPFLSLLATFAQRLEAHDLLLVCGYSFQDIHINVILRRWFNRKPQRRMLSVEAPGAPQRDHWFAQRPDRYMQLSVGAEKALACLFTEPP